MPPHSPVDASPTPMIRGSSGPNRMVGPDGQAFAKWKPWMLGLNLGTETSVTSGS
jgi:hypothetical protein